MNSEQRDETIRNARALLDFLEQTPEAEMASYSGLSLYLYRDGQDGRDMVHKVMAASPGGWSKEDSSDYPSTVYRKTFGTSEETSAAYVVNISKASTCQRVQVGWRHVEAQPAEDVPVYKWSCPQPGDGEDS